MNLDLFEELEPSSENDADFDFETPLPSWDDGKESFDQALNCHGVVYVRLLCAQRLPCPVGSSVCGAVSLPPWRGRVRTSRVSAFLSSLEHGVCVRWERETNAGFCSMVNAWNSSESPVPSIQVDLMFSPLGMGLLDFTICSLALPCESLMQAPGIWKGQWCQATLSEPKNSDGELARVDDRTPLIKLEAMFSPTAEKKRNLSPPPRSRVNSVPDPHQSPVYNSPQRTRKPEVTVQASPRRTQAMMEMPLPSDPETSSVTDRTADLADSHLLRVDSFWVPASCSVCSAVLFGRNSGFQCEECHIYCCPDCHLHVDLQIPCGSDAAVAVAAKQQNVSLDKLLSVVAPDDNWKKSDTRTDNFQDSAGKPLSPISGSRDRRVGIGCLKLDIQTGCLFERSFPPDTAPEIIFDDKSKPPLRQGDYYARVTVLGSDRTSRTRTLQGTGMPKFASPEMQFIIPHYGAEFRLDVVNASTDIPVGTTILTTQGILQNQRDLMIAEMGGSLLKALAGPLKWKGKRVMKLELRAGIKDANGADFYNTAKRNDLTTTAESSATSPGRISGWIEVNIGLEEFLEQLYGLDPYECPPRPTQQLDMTSFQTHLNRAKALVAMLSDGFDQCVYIISWKDPTLTFSSLVLFVTFCCRFDAEYWSSLPFLFLLLLSLNFWLIRSGGGGKDRFLRKEVEASRKTEAVSLCYNLYRPIGLIDVAVTKGRNLYSKDLGLPGRTSCHVFWDPKRYASEKMAESLLKIDQSSQSQQEIGHTKAYYSADPEWGKVYKSTGTRRLMHILLHEDGLEESSEQLGEDGDVSFPVLQPFTVKSTRVASLKPWDSSPGAIVIQVKFQDFLNNLPGFDHVLGEVVIPFSMLTRTGEVKGWFQVLDVGTKQIAPCSADEILGTTSEEERSDGFARDSALQCIFVVLKWSPPGKIDNPSETDLEISFAIQEELVRSSEISKQQSSFDLVGTVNTALGIGGNVQSLQNSLGSVLDQLEAVVNAFNFTDPFKSSLLFLLLFCIWVVLILVPTRIMIFLIGLSQYGTSFVARYGVPFFNSKDDSAPNLQTAIEKSSSTDEIKPTFFEIWINNGIRSLPTNEDLRKTYFWEGQRLGALESEKHASEKRLTRLKRLWKVRWYSFIKIRVDDSGEPSPTDARNSEWRDAFAIIQGHKFLWWDNVRDFDNGGLPVGKLFLSGHSGLTGPSPLEMRKLSKEELDLTVAIFGRGAKVQERITMLVSSSNAKDSLENAIIEAIDYPKDE